MTQELTIDPIKAEAFAGRALGYLNGATQSLMWSIGHQTGLLDKLAQLPPSTSAQIADKAGLNERYVREWLGSLTTSGVISYDPATKTYVLPPEHAAFLTRAAGANNFAQLAQYIAMMGKIEAQVVNCFRNGGGVPYSAMPEFQHLQREETAVIYDATLLDVTLPLVPGLTQKLEAGIDVVDLGCGAGHAICVMGEAFPNSRFTGYDLSEEGIAMAQAEAAARSLTNVRFEVKDIATLSGPARYDLITGFDIVHDQAAPRRVLKGIYEALKPEGDFLCVDIAASSNLEDNVEHPMAPTLYALSTFHCMTVSLAQGGEGLGTVWGEQKAHELFAEAGFSQVDTKRVEGDMLNNYYVIRK